MLYYTLNSELQLQYNDDKMNLITMSNLKLG